MRDKFSYYHIVTEGETLSSIAESYFGRNGSRHVGAFIDANPWPKDAAQQQLDGGYAPWRRVIKGWDPKVSYGPVNGVLNLSNVVLSERCLWAAINCWRSNAEIDQLMLQRLMAAPSLKHVTKNSSREDAFVECRLS